MLINVTLYGKVNDSILKKKHNASIGDSRKLRIYLLS
ncbi:MAG: hypothetical protein UY62_C0003G0015 [Parcubacteria group bacterium GW2011_GWF2_50_9]|nr:MAG: hypothetical protein UY62_C0003G0015 [Parcubacteria group bacterium GW2011_GWF2_50_9]